MIDFHRVNKNRFFTDRYSAEIKKWEHVLMYVPCHTTIFCLFYVHRNERILLFLVSDSFFSSRLLALPALFWFLANRKITVPKVSVIGNYMSA